MWIDIDRTCSQSLAVQIYNGVKTSILNGVMAAGEKLPSTRSLSDNLGVSRNCVMEAYEQLYAEGYVESRHGSGTRVAEGIALCRKAAARPGYGAVDIMKKENRLLVDFRSGLPAVELFPVKEWRQAFNQVCMEMKADVLDYGQPEGRPELREALSDYLFRVRGIDCGPGRILITSGATQGISLVSRLLYTPGAAAIMEDPSSYGAYRIVSSYGYRVLPAAVDNSGIMTDRLDTLEKAGFIYVTPSHQFPLGGILSVQRRLELVKLAQDTGSFILEDDYDSEFRYAGHPVSSLYSLDPEHVIYAGSFSKILSPALRLGYVILPPSLVKQYRSLKRYSDAHTASLEQLVLAGFIKEGQLDRHVSRMKKVYFNRRQAMLSGLSSYFPGEHTVSGYSTGLHLIAEFPGRDISETLVKRAAESGVGIYPVEFHAIKKGNHREKLIMGYGHLTPESIGKGLELLKGVFSAAGTSG